jgi:hypothetical protein
MDDDIRMNHKQKHGGELRREFTPLRIGASGWLFFKRRGISWPAESLSASKEWL